MSTVVGKKTFKVTGNMANTPSEILVALKLAKLEFNSVFVI